MFNIVLAISSLPTRPNVHALSRAALNGASERFGRVSCGHRIEHYNARITVWISIFKRKSSSPSFTEIICVRKERCVSCY